MTEEQIQEDLRKLTSVDQTDYYEQKKINEEQFTNMVKAVRPDIGVIMETLDSTGVNWKVIWKVIFALNNIANDTHYGTVSILIEDNIVRFVRGEHADKINEPIFLDIENEEM
jgi:hypothetical protein